MADITGSFRRADRPIVYFEAKQDGERWSCLAKVGGERFEASTWKPSPWETIERLIGEALDSGSRDTEPAKFDMNRKLAKPAAKPTTPLRRRGSLPPGSVPEWTPPTD
jgi:hypothetical protein